VNKYISKRQKRIRILKAIAVFLLFICLLIGLSFTKIGNNLVKEILSSKINHYVNGVRITFLEYGINSFSINLKKDDNILKIYGELFPLNAMFEGNFDNISALTSEFRGKMQLNGRLYKAVNNYKADGTAYFASGNLNFKIGFKPFDIVAQGDGFDIKKLLYMLKIRNDLVTGTTSLHIIREKSSYKIELNSAGNIPYFDVAFKSFTKINAKNKRNFSFLSHITSDMGMADIEGYEKNGKLECDMEAKDVNLSYLKKFLIYPLKDLISFKGRYNSASGIFKFKSKDFEGFYDDHLEITFKLKSDKFFEYIGLKKLFDGIITGIVKINKTNGTFDLVSNNTKLLNNSILKKIYKLSGIDLNKENLSKVFFRGTFNNKYVSLDVLSTNDTISLNIKNGKYYYNGKYSFILFIRKNNNVYEFKISNGIVRLIKSSKFKQENNKVLVY
jgi:hypothetical protein